jgi:hypothetical protein
VIPNTLHCRSVVCAAQQEQPLTKGRKRGVSVLGEKVIALSSFLTIGDVCTQLWGVKMVSRPNYPIVLQKQASTAGECSLARRLLCGAKMLQLQHCSSSAEASQLALGLSPKLARFGK